MLPGKQYTPEEILAVVWRRKWVIVLPFAISSLVTAAVSRRIPKIYQSETVILVVPQRVPESYVRSTITARIEDRLGSISSQILSRSRLERIVEDFNLYPEQRRTQPMEAVIEQMRNAITPKVERGDAFRISYTSGDPRLAQQVTERLATLFIEENLRDREVQAQGTNQFLDSQLDEARKRLVQHEQKLETYKRRYGGELPTQVQTNMQAIQSAEMQLQALNESMSRDRDRRLVVERQVADLSAPDSAAMVGAGPVSQVVTTAQQLAQAQADLKVLEQRYKPEHPDIAAANRLVRDLTAKLRAEEQSRSANAPPPDTATPNQMLRDNRRRQLQEEIGNLDRQLARKEQEQIRLQTMVTSYQSKIDAAPTREAELTELTRDYSTLQSSYTSLLAKRQDSKIAANLERNQAGEQFKLMDPARVPERPFAPNLAKINGLGAAAGLAIGLAIVALLEYFDSTFRREEDIARILQIQVLAVVPVMAPVRVVRWRQRLQAASAFVAVAVFVGVAAAVALWSFRLS